MDQVREQRDASGENEDERLRDSCCAEDAKTEEDRVDAGARAEDRAVDEAVRVPVIAFAAGVILLVVRKRGRVLYAVAQDASSIRSR